MLKLNGRKFILGLVIILSACSAQQVPLQSQLVPYNGSNPGYLLEEAVIVTASKTAKTTLKAGTHWSIVGEINEGTVYKTKDQVVIVNSFNVHEGFIVVSNSNVVGYYLPIEKTFVKSKPVNIKLAQKEK